MIGGMSDVTIQPTDPGSCLICGRKSDRLACQVCQQRMRKQLSELLEYQELAADNLLPGSKGDGRSTDKSLGVNISALDVIGAFDAISVLESWERMWRQDYGLAAYGLASAERPNTPEGQLRGIIDFLQSWLDISCEKQSSIDDFAHELRTLHRDSKQAAGFTNPNTWRVTCPTDTEDGECGKQLRVASEDFDKTVACRECKTVWPVERLLRVVATSNNSEIWLDPIAASEYLGVDASTLRRWAAAGKILRRNGMYEINSLRNPR